MKSHLKEKKQHFELGHASVSQMCEICDRNAPFGEVVRRKGDPA